MGILDAHVGYAYKCSLSENSDGKIFWSLQNYFECENNKPVKHPNSSTSTQIPEDLVTPMLLAHCLTETEPFSIELPKPRFTPTIDDYAIIPIADQTRLFAVVVLANSANGFSSKIESRIRPFLRAASSIMRFMDASEKNEQRRLPPDADNPRDYLLNVADLVENTFDGLFVVNQDNRIIFCNKTAAELLGSTPELVEGHDMDKHLPTDSPPLVRDSSKKRKGVDTWYGLELKTVAGTNTNVDIRYFDIYRGAHSLRVLIVKESGKRLEQASPQSAQQSFRVLTNVAPVAILQLNRDWECTYVNDSWCEYSQLSPSESLGISWIEALHDEDQHKVLENIRTSLLKDGKYDGEFRLQTPFGRTRWVKANACSLYSDEGSVTGLIMTMSDITDHLKTEAALRNMAERDQLTGLTNRAFFTDRLQHALASIQRLQDVSLLFFDLDDFKHVNDTLGHNTGDELLQAVAVRLQNTLRKVDTIARLGGDEFVILVNSLENQNHLNLVADKIIGIFAEPFQVAERSLYITCSMGIATAKGLTTTGTQLLKQADVALYKAKAAGRNQYRFYTQEMDKFADLHIHLRQSLRGEMRSDFRLVFQPQIDSRSNKVIGIEALTRWECEHAPGIGPDLFMKMIEQSGLIDDFSGWLLESAFSAAIRWQKYLHPGLRLAINLSGRQFYNDQMARDIIRACECYRVDPRVIELEVTETALIEDTDLAKELLNQLKAAGFTISLDDFGTGYSSLVHLRTMPIDTIKVDGSFVQDVTSDQEDAQIVEAILTLASTLDLEVIAEGVEDERTRHWLEKRGCFNHQGFLYYRPISEAEMTSLLETQRTINKISTAK